MTRSIILCYEQTEPTELMYESADYIPKKKVTQIIMGQKKEFIQIDP